MDKVAFLDKNSRDPINFVYITEVKKVSSTLARDYSCANSKIQSKMNRRSDIVTIFPFLNLTVI